MTIFDLIKDIFIILGYFILLILLKIIHIIGLIYIDIRDKIYRYKCPNSNENTIEIEECENE